MYPLKVNSKAPFKKNVFHVDMERELLENYTYYVNSNNDGIFFQKTYLLWTNIVSGGRMQGFS